MESGLNEGCSRKEVVENGDLRQEESPKAADVVIDLNCESPKAEMVCRICHFNSDEDSTTGPGSELVLLGCNCRGELGFSHYNCAHAWFTQKGNRLCEICGLIARNIVVNEDEDASIQFMMEWNEMRAGAAILDGYDQSSRVRRRCNKSLWNVVLGCLIIAFIIPWVFRRIHLL